MSALDSLIPDKVTEITFLYEGRNLWNVKFKRQEDGAWAGFAMARPGANQVIVPLVSITCLTKLWKTTIETIQKVETMKLEEI